MLTSLLKTSSLFRDLDDEMLRQLVSACDVLRMPRGETLMSQGEIGDCLYFVVTGRLRFYVEHEDASDTLVGEIAAGETVGELALLTDEPRTATVRAIRNSILLRLDRSSFERLAAGSSSLMQQLAKMIALRQSRLRPAHVRRAPTVVTLLPLDVSVPVSALRDQLVSEFERIGTVSAFNNAEFQEDCASTGQERTDDPTLRTHVDQSESEQWFTKQETSSQRLVLVGDYEATPWNERCIRAADVVLLVGRGGSVASATDVDRQVQSFQDSRECAAVDLILLHETDADQFPGTKHWLQSRQVRHLFHVRDTTADISRLGRILSDRAVGVVLSGGGARGFAHIGILKALSELPVPIDFIGGCSMGAIIAAQFASGWDWREILDKNTELWTRQRIWDYTVPFVSLIAGRSVGKRLVKMFGDLQIEDLHTNYFCVTSDLTNATLCVHNRGLLWKAVSASASIPGVLPPQVFEGNLHVDGGLLNNLPVAPMHEYTRGPVLAVDVAARADLSVDSKLKQLPTGGFLLRRHLNPFAARAQTPNIISILWRSAVLASIMRTPDAKSLADVYVRPDVGNFSILDFRKIELLVETGYNAMKAQLSNWEVVVANSQQAETYG